MSDTPEWDEWMLEQGAASPSGPREALSGEAASPAAMDALRLAINVYDATPVHEIDQESIRAQEGRIILAARDVVESGPSPAAGLDPERLARALENCGLGLYHATEPRMLLEQSLPSVIAEYDRLSRSEGGEAPPPPGYSSWEAVDAELAEHEGDW